MGIGTRKRKVRQELRAMMKENDNKGSAKRETRERPASDTH